ncbi:hypothetical protein Nepgr_012316 [Nepenthes gracilis]|uniref:Uncharacterized protein n=1 Tax=Nepenthes gracilis TaxID=150966 RepID=A0AAD3SFI2_NEPGR|nr:hypothetical protein Nepgr_012316 [Nepenthes gracilis]
MSIPNNSRVAVHSKLTVVSSTPTEPGQAFPLSALDHAMGRHTLHIIFYYRSEQAGRIQFEPIRRSLSELLSLYPTVTGRLGRDGEGNWEVKCTDAGVRVLRAKVATTFDEWLRSADGEEEKDLAVWEDMPDDPCIWSPFRIQMNEFEGGGVAIALSCAHMLADPTFATLLIKSWTDAQRGEPIGHPPFIYPPALRSRPTSNATTKATAYYASKAKLEEPPPLNMATTTFNFSSSAIKRELSKIHAHCPEASPFDLLTALFWSRIHQTMAPKNDPKRSLSICTDFRKRLHAPLPYGYFGNTMLFSRLTLGAEELDGGDLGLVVRSVHSHTAGLEEEEFWSTINWFHSIKDEKGKFAPPFAMYGPELTCVDMEHLIAPSGPSGGAVEPLMYMAMFEKDVKPEHVSYLVGNVGGEGLILVMPSPEGGLARRVAVTLPEEQMVKLRENRAILSLEPTLILSRGR